MLWEALRLAPRLEEWFRSDPDLAALRPQSVAQFYSGWEGYQQRMVQALAPLSSEQLAWSAGASPPLGGSRCPTRRRGSRSLASPRAG